MVFKKLPFLSVILSYLPALILSLVICLPASGVDPALDSKNSYALLIKEMGLVEYRNIEGEVLETIPVAAHLYDDASRLLAVPYKKKFAVLAIATEGRRQNATASLITSEGIVGSVYLGSIKNSTILAYDLTHNGTFDLVNVGKRGNTAIFFAPFTSEFSGLEFRVPKRPKDQVSLTSHQGTPALVILRTKRKAPRNPNARRPILKAQVRPITDPGQVYNYKLPKRTKGEIIPLLSGTNLLAGEFLLVNQMTRSTQYGYLDLAQNHLAKKNLQTSAVFATGDFYQPGYPSQLLLSSAGNLTVIDPADQLAPIFQTSLLEDGSLTPPQGDGSGPDGCIDTVPYALIQQIISSYTSGNWYEAMTLLNSMAWEELCPETSDEANQLLLVGLGFSFAESGGEDGALFSNVDQYALLASPIISSSADSNRIPGCDVLRSASDGVNGFVYKTGEKDGKVAALLPSNIITTKAWLTRKNGKNIERLKFDGRTNGWRATFRSKKVPRAYPKKLVVKAKVQTGFDTEQFYCWVLTNSHVRND